MGDTQKDIADLREATRLAHEAIQDLRTIVREAAEAKSDLEVIFNSMAKEMIIAAVERGLTDYQTALKVAIDDGTKAIFQRFDRLTNILLGASKTDPQGELERIIIERAGYRPS